MTFPVEGLSVAFALAGRFTTVRTVGEAPWGTRKLAFRPCHGTKETCKDPPCCSWNFMNMDIFCDISHLQWMNSQHDANRTLEGLCDLGIWPLTWLWLWAWPVDVWATWIHLSSNIIAMHGYHNFAIYQIILSYSSQCEGPHKRPQGLCRFSWLGHCKQRLGWSAQADSTSLQYSVVFMIMHDSDLQMDHCMWAAWRSRIHKHNAWECFTCVVLNWHLIHRQVSCEQMKSNEMFNFPLLHTQENHMIYVVQRTRFGGTLPQFSAVTCWSLAYQ